MNKLPQFLPKYSIEECNLKPFEVTCEELPGWFIIPTLNEKLSWAMNEVDTKEKSWQYKLIVFGEAEAHGIKGVEVIAKPYGDDITGCSNPSDDLQPATLVAQLTDSHCRFLSCCFVNDGVKTLKTFLDGDSFLNN